MKILKVRSAGLDEFPQGVGKMDKLEVLDLSDNRIQQLDQATAALFKLKRLELRGNMIKVRSLRLLTWLAVFLQVPRGRAIHAEMYLKKSVSALQTGTYQA